MTNILTLGVLMSSLKASGMLRQLEHLLRRSTQAGREVLGICNMDMKPSRQSDKDCPGYSRFPYNGMQG